MADETLTGANVVISSPAQQFTRTDQFQALFYGKIYIGKIDKDPTKAENQIDVFIEQEDNSLFKVPQPLRTNAAGFPVYNGKIVKFVTTEGHSMALYDSNDVLQNYYNNVLKYDPDQFSGSVGGPDGLKVVGRCSSVDQLRQIVGVPDQWINVASYNEGTHVGGGFFYWVNDLLDTDDGGVFFRVNANGGWRRDLPSVDALNILHFGAISDGKTDAMPAMQRMHAWSTKFSQSIGVAGTYGPGIVLPPGRFAASSMDLGTSEIGAFKLIGPHCFYGVIPRVTLLPINKTTTTPMFAFTARRQEVSGIHWDGAGTVQPFMLNRVTRGSYLRTAQFVATDYGGRVFQAVDTIDTKFDQCYAYRGTKSFLVAGWSNQNPGAWDHSTAIEIANCNFTSNTGEPVILAIRATQCIMRNTWFTNNYCAWDFSQGGWFLDNVTIEGATTAAKCQYAKFEEIYCRYAQGAGLDFNASGYDPSMDDPSIGGAGRIPSWVTNAYDQGRVSINHAGTLFDCGVATEFNWSNQVIDNSATNANTWYNLGYMSMPRLGDSTRIKIVGAANWDSAGGNFDRPGGTAFGSGLATIALEMKAPNVASTSLIEAHWWGEDNSPIMDVRIVHEWQRLTIYVRMRQYAKYGAMFVDTTGTPRWRSGSPFYFRPDMSAVTDDAIAALTNAVTPPCRKSWNKGDYASNGFGMDFDSGDFVLYQKNRVSAYGINYIPMMYNGEKVWIAVNDQTLGEKLPFVSKAQLATLSPATYVARKVLVSDARGTPYGRGTSREAWSDGYQWTWADDLSVVSFT